MTGNRYLPRGSNEKTLCITCTGNVSVSRWVKTLVTILLLDLVMIHWIQRNSFRKNSIMLVSKEVPGSILSAHFKRFKRIIILSHIYRPQMKFAKVMFLHLSVSHSVHGGEVVSQHAMGQHYISSCTGVESQLEWRQDTGDIKCKMG